MVRTRTRGAYPTFIKEEKGTYLVYVPDFDTSTEGESFVDAIAMARDAIGLMGISLTEKKKEIPAPSSAEDAIRKTKETAEEIDYDYSLGTLTYVDIDFETYFRRLNSKMVKKNCTLPYWMNEEAEKRGINFSKVLQDGLLKILGA